jgi:hypothetical protein
MAWRAAMAGLEAAIAFSAALNAAYFLRRALSVERFTRKAAALLLAIIALGTLAEGIVVIVSLRASDETFFAPAAWLFARSITLLGTGCITTLVLKAMGNGK